MRYNVVLFVLDAEAFAARLRDVPDDVLEATREHWADAGVEDKDLDYGIELAREICLGRIASPASLDHFWALYWLLAPFAERIPLSTMEGFKSIAYVADVGLWPLLGTHVPPFSTPHSDETPSAVGYLPRSEIRAARAFLEHLDAGDAFVRETRRSFVEVLESLEGDELDLIALLIE